MPLFQTLYSRGCTPNIHRVRDGKRTREASWAGHALGPQEGSHDLSVRPYFPAEMLASCSQIYFFHRSCKPRIPREISPFLNGGKEFHFQEKKKMWWQTLHFKIQVCLDWTTLDWNLLSCLYINLSLLLPQISFNQPPGSQSTPNKLLVAKCLLLHWKLSWTYWQPYLPGRDQGLGTLSTQLVTGI